MKLWPHVSGWFMGGALLYVYFYYFFDWSATKALLATANFQEISLALFFFLLTLSTRALKWTYIIRLRESVSWIACFHVVMVSNLANFIFPVRFGEIFKLYLIKRIGQVNYSTSVSASLTDKLSQLSIIVLFLFLAPIAGFSNIEQVPRLVVFFVPLLILVVFFFICGTYIFEKCEKLLNRILAVKNFSTTIAHRFPNRRLFTFIQSTLEKTNALSMKRNHLLAIAFLSFATIVLDGLCFYFIIGSFNLPLTWLQGTLAACFMNLVFVLPTPPGQVGTAEMYPVIIFSWGLGFPNDVISSSAILWHALTMGVVVVLGLVSSVSLGIGFKDFFSKVPMQEKEASW